jgi:mono/diheme cytochrome c family protein
VGNVSRSSWGTASGLPSQVIYRLAGSRDSENVDPATLEPSIASGRSIFKASCSVCHGPAGVGGEASALVGLYSGITQSELVSKIIEPPENMPRFYPATMTAQDVADVAAYVRSLSE